SIPSSDSVTRTTPSRPTRSPSSSARSGSPFRLPRACGLTMTPKPGTSGGGSRRGELSTRSLDVLPAALPDGRRDAVRAQEGLEAEDAVARARREARARIGIEGDQVHLGAQPVQEPDEPARIDLGVVLAAQHDVFERDPL